MSNFAFHIANNSSNSKHHLLRKGSNSNNNNNNNNIENNNINNNITSRNFIPSPSHDENSMPSLLQYPTPPHSHSKSEKFKTVNLGPDFSRLKSPFPSYFSLGDVMNPLNYQALKSHKHHEKMFQPQVEFNCSMDDHVNPFWNNKNYQLDDTNGDGIISKKMHTSNMDCNNHSNINNGTNNE